jgi:hypothetical protein
VGQWFCGPVGRLMHRAHSCREEEGVDESEGAVIRGGADRQIDADRCSDHNSDDDDDDDKRERERERRATSEGY